MAKALTITSITEDYESTAATGEKSFIILIVIVNTSRMTINKISGIMTLPQIKLYSYLVRMIGSYHKERDVWVSKSYLATKIDTKRPTISVLTDALNL